MGLWSRWGGCVFGLVILYAIGVGSKASGVVWWLG